MVESVGKKLSQARQKRGLSVDAAAHATKLRPDKIAALEADDYTRFANNIYAKGFLQIYAKFLNVDVSDFARTLDNANPISVSDYQYLSNAPARRQEPTTVRRTAERQPPSLAPLLFFIALIGLIVVSVWGFNTYQQSQGAKSARNSSKAAEIGLAPTNPDAAFIDAPAPTPFANPAPAPAVAPAAAVVKPAPAVVANHSTPAPASATPAAHPALTAAPAPATPVPAPAVAVPPVAVGPAPVAANAPTATPSAKNPEQDYVTPTPVADAENHAASTSGTNEVLVATVKKTWVTVRKDDPKAPPIFEDYVYPSANPLKLKGARFFIDAKEPSAVQITKNGLPIAYQGPAVSVQ